MNSSGSKLLEHAFGIARVRMFHDGRYIDFVTIAPGADEYEVVDWYELASGSPPVGGCGVLLEQQKTLAQGQIVAFGPASSPSGAALGYQTGMSLSQRAVDPEDLGETFKPLITALPGLLAALDDYGDPNLVTFGRLLRRMKEIFEKKSQAFWLASRDYAEPARDGRQTLIAYASQTVASAVHHDTWRFLIPGYVVTMGMDPKEQRFEVLELAPQRLGTVNELGPYFGLTRSAPKAREPLSYACLLMPRQNLGSGSDPRLVAALKLALKPSAAKQVRAVNLEPRDHSSFGDTFREKCDETLDLLRYHLSGSSRKFIPGLDNRTASRVREGVEAMARVLKLFDEPTPSLALACSGVS